MVPSKYSICGMKAILRNLNCVQCLNKAPIEIALWPQWNIPSWFTTPKEKVRFYERVFLEVVIAMVKDKKHLM